MCQALIAGINGAARDTGVPFRAWGHPPMSAIEFIGLRAVQANVAWERLLGEMAGRGVLLRRGGLNFITYSHRPVDIERTVAAFHASLIALRPLLDPPLAIAGR